MSKFNEEMKIPYVSKELCEYLRETYSLPNALHMVNQADSPASAMGAMGVIYGINSVIERLEAVVAQQEENDGIH